LNVSACGYGAIATLMSLTKKLDGKIELIRHSTSAEVSRDYLSVVGYRALVAYY
jgi:AmmeMemoRadiSam system protein B